MRCRYCFYLSKSSLYRQAAPRMSISTLQLLTRKFMSLPLASYNFGWQGGEPTLMGLDFFRQAIEFQKQYGHSGLIVANGLQTNGTLLDHGWGEFLRRYNFLVGISLDGPAKLHDLGRFHPDGRGSHAEARRGLAILQRHQVEHNVLTLISASNQDYPLEIYHYLKDLGLNYHQYIECTEFDAQGQLLPFALRPGRWGEFLCTIFDEWYKRDTKNISIRLFDSILVRLIDGYANCCSLGLDCRQYFVIEHNGDVYPCDFYVQPELKLGNIEVDKLETMQQSSRFREFGLRKSAWNNLCPQCEYLPLCAGGCPKSRPGQNPANLSVLCPDWRLFYRHTLGRFQKLAAEIKAERKRNAIPQNTAGRTTGRNNPCPCGSGKKYKKCCGT